MNNLNLYSFKSVRIEELSAYTKKNIGSSSGFICIQNQRYYLITNWHVVSGRNFQTKTITSDHGAIPGFLTLHLHTREIETESTIKPLMAQIKEIALYETKEDELDLENPLWIEHPEFKSNVDVVALEITKYIPQDQLDTIVAHNPQNENEISRHLNVMDDVFIIGYPLPTNTTPNAYPIYKKASVASEPDIFSTLPIFYVDGKTKKGMSGSAVVKMERPQLEINGLELKMTTAKTSLVGIYSGRDGQNKDEHEAELGIVWRIEECLLPILDTA